MWIIATEGALFAYLLFSYYYIAIQPHSAGTFPPEIPSIDLSLPNTLILITSSVFVAIAQHGIMRGHTGRLVVGMGIGLALGITFLIVQYYEWKGQSFTLADSPYSSLFYVVTGFHMAHVFVGVLGLLAIFVWSSMGYFSRTRYAHVHIVAVYWHFVDVVWLAIFFTFYLTPRIMS